MAKSNLKTSEVLEALKLVGKSLNWNTQVEVLLIGGVAGMVTGVLKPDRTTGDCDVADLSPAEAAAAVEKAAAEVAAQLNLPEKWFNDQAGQLNVLPDGWRSRRQHVATFGKLKVYAASRLDLLAMKIFAHRAPDREDVQAMGIRPDEVEFVRRYLDMLKVPSRKADLDQVHGAEEYLDAMEDKAK